MSLGNRAASAREAQSEPDLRLTDASPQSGSGVTASAALEVVADLASDLAHDLSNELSAALNYSYLLSHALEHEPALKAHVDELQAATWRAARLTQSLKHFPPRRAQRREPLDVNAVIASTTPVLQRLLSEHTLETALAAHLGAPLGARTELERVLVGLTLHARDASPRGGTIVLVTEALHGSAAPMVRLSCVRHRPEVRWRDDSSRVVPRGTSARWALFRRALRRLGARLSHGNDAVHVDLPG